MSIDTHASYVRFVYPFTFESDLFSRLSHQAGKARWIHQDKAHVIWEEAKFPEDDLLPHIAQFLNARDLAGRNVEEATAYLWHLKNESLRSPNWGLGAQTNWSASVPSWQQPIGFRWDAIELALFRTGTGILTFEITVDSTDPAEWLDFIHHFRFYDGPRSPRLSVIRKVGANSSQPVPLINSSPASPPNDLPISDMKGIIRKLLTTINDSDSSAIMSWQDVFVPGRLMPFLCLIESTKPGEERNALEYFYRVRNIITSAQQHSLDESGLLEPDSNIIPYAERQWFFFTLEGAGYVAFGPPPSEFFLKTLPDHIRKQYFLLYILALNQRFTLLGLQRDIATRWIGPKTSTKTYLFKRIYERLLEYEARDYFPQAMQRDHHHSCYRKLQDIFQIPQMHKQLRDEVQAMFEWARIERDNSLRKKLDLLMFLVGFPSLIFIFLTVPWKDMGVSFLSSLLLFVTTLAAGAIIIYLSRKTD